MGANLSQSRRRGENFSQPEVSGSFLPMRISTQNVDWSGIGPVAIPFTTNQRGTFWLAIYELGSAETGERGPNGAWLRLAPQDKFIAVTARQTAELGQNVIMWDARDFDGNAVKSGNYAFDLIGVNDQDKPVLAGPGPRDFTKAIVDTRFDPPEVWVHTSDRQKLASGETSGDIVRGTLGTDYIANPRAFERWNYTDIFEFDGSQTIGGMRVDDEDPDIFWTSQVNGDNSGLYKMRIARQSRSWRLVTDFGDDGHSVNGSRDRVTELEPWGPKGIVYNGLWGQQQVPFCAIESRDKNTGEISGAFDVTEFYLTFNIDSAGNESATGNGPGHMDVNRHGIWMTSWAAPAVVFMDHDGNIIWVNGNGDQIGDTINIEEATQLGISAVSGNNIQIRPDISGRAAFFTISGNNRGAHISTVGRDGSGLFEIAFSSDLGPFRPDATWHLTIVDENGPYDGFYYGSPLGALGGATSEGGQRGPGELLHIPFDLASGLLGEDVTAVEEETGAETPNSYRLGAAYPNPFNPETSIEFAVPVEERVRIEVFNTIGQQLAVLVDEDLSAGVYEVSWKAIDENGRRASSGIYFYRMRAGDFTDTRSVTLLK